VITLKKRLFFSIVALLVLMVGCTKGTIEEQNIFYFGEGNEWFSTYTISKVNGSYFDSLYIQYVTDRTEPLTDRVGEIEYHLSVGEMFLSSTYPQPLQGVGNFHTASEMNADFFTMEFPDKVTLEIRWQDKVEKIILKKQN
jgi:hypothetical protein